MAEVKRETPIYVSADRELLERIDRLLAANLLRGKGPRTRARYALEAIEARVKRDEKEGSPS